MSWQAVEALRAAACERTTREGALKGLALLGVCWSLGCQESPNTLPCCSEFCLACFFRHDRLYPIRVLKSVPWVPWSQDKESVTTVVVAVWLSVLKSVLLVI